MSRWRLDLSYDGSDFHGWARQPGLRTVQGVVEDSLATVLRLAEPPTLTCAGRTDAGVHAAGQVAHVDLPADDDAWVPRMRRLLPDDIGLGPARPTTADFDARFSALWRRYRYRVCDDQATWDPLLRTRVVRQRRAVDVEAMTAAGSGLIGTHDFAALCRPRPGASTVREIQALTWSRDARGHAVMDVRADAFCHSMVRALVGLLLPIGEGRRPVAWAADVIRAGVRDPAVTVMPPHGLVLVEVGYPPDADLAERQQVTRAYRAST
jgi:tRNA pseudouridine38-40 synthase